MGTFPSGALSPRKLATGRQGTVFGAQRGFVQRQASAAEYVSKSGAPDDEVTFDLSHPSLTLPPMARAASIEKQSQQLPPSRGTIDPRHRGVLSTAMHQLDKQARAESPEGACVSNYEPLSKRLTESGAST
jgi:hypothetical protein